MDVDNRTAGEYMLACFRILVGWLFLWPFFDKIFGLGFQTPKGQGWIDGVSPSSQVMYVADGVFEDFYNAIAGNLLIDILFLMALLIIGITLIIGIASKLTTLFSIMFLVVIYTLCIPPVDNPIIDYHLVLCAGLLAAYFLGGLRKAVAVRQVEGFLPGEKVPDPRVNSALGGKIDLHEHRDLGGHDLLGHLADELPCGGHRERHLICLHQMTQI